MRKHQWIWLGLAMTLVVGSGCDGGVEPLADPPVYSPVSTLVIVLNGLAETLSVGNLDTGEWNQNTVTVGETPNHLALAGGGSHLLVTASGANAVQVVELENWSVVREIDLGPGSNPWETQLQHPDLDDPIAYTTEWLAHSVAKIDWQRGAVLARIPVAPSPQGLAWVGDKLYVASTRFADDPTLAQWGVVSAVQNDSVVAEIRVGRNPQSLIRVGDELHVVCTGRYGLAEGQVMIVDTHTDRVTDSLAVGGSPAFAAAIGRRVFVTGYAGGLMEYDAPSRSIVHDAENPGVPIDGLFGIAVNPVVPSLWVAAFEDDVVFETAPDPLSIRPYPVGDGPQSIVVRVPAVAPLRTGRPE